MKYLIVNPYGPAYGITSYSKHLARRLGARIAVDYIGNGENIPWEDFRRRVADYVVTTYLPDEVVIEVPEARAAAKYVPEEYRLHVRLHAGAIAAFGESFELNVDRLDTELGLMRRATVVSSSSHAVVTQLEGLVDGSGTHVFKNPADGTIRRGEASDKDIDVLFMGRFELLKGREWLLPLLERLPASYRAMVVGPGIEDFVLPEGAKCDIGTAPTIFDRSRFDLMARARVFLMLSRFENCSLAVMEALASGTVVVGWDVGGNSEMAPPPVMRLLPVGDLEALTHAVLDVCQSEYPSPTDFRDVTDGFDLDFEEGWAKVCAHLMTGEPQTPHNGLTHRVAHQDSDPRLAATPTLLPLLEAYTKARNGGGV